MAVASFESPAVIYREEQNFDWRVYALIVLIEAVVGGLAWSHRAAVHPPGAARFWTIDGPIGLIASLIVPAALVIGLLRMTTEVTPTELRVWFGWVPTYRRVLNVAAIQRIEVVTYRPIADYWGWGIRSGRDAERVYNARGNRGVRLDLADGTRILIGSQRPETLAAVLESTIMPPAV